MEIINKLINPFEGLELNDVNGIQTRCKEIAEELFRHYGIKCGNKTFCFAEIEFYYYKKEKSGNNNWDAPWNKETYPRSKNAGDFFFHYSGVDICFQCNFIEKEKEDEYGEFGGILVRSLLDGDKVLAGPLFCANAMLNACKDHMPQLTPYHQECELDDPTTRYGINDDKLQLCYYRKDLNWNGVSERIGWDKNKGVFKRITRNYYNDRFENKVKINSQTDPSY